MKTKANKKTLVLMISLLLMTGIFFPIADSQTNALTAPLPLENIHWWNSNWPYRKLVTIDHTKVVSNLRNFPVLINISSDTDFAAKAQNDGDDIVFILYSDNITKLNHELELFNGSTGRTIAWVNVTSLSSTIDTKMWLYYGNNVCSSQQNVLGTWDSHYVMVQHLNETNGTTAYDSTQFGNDGTPSGGMNQNVTGKIDGADKFDGLDDSINVANSASLQLSDKISVEIWAKAGTFDAWRTVVAKDQPGTNEWWFGYNDLNTLDFKFNGQIGINIDASTVISDTGWHYLVGVFDGTDISVFVDGVLDCTPTSYVSIIPNTGAVTFGLTNYWGDNRFNGILDEVRLSNIARNSSWLGTSYKNQNNPESFYSIGTEEPYEYTLTTTIDPIGAGTIITAPTPPYHYNDTVILAAITNPGYTFNSWSGDLTGNTNPTSITMNEDKTVIAHFSQNHYTLAVTIQGQGTVTKDPDQPWYTYGQIVTLTAVAAHHWAFDYWSGDLTGNSNPATIMIDSNKSVIATFVFVNSPPLANNDHYTTAEDTPLFITAPGVLANDIDNDGDSLTCILVNGSQGTLYLHANGSFEYHPPLYYYGVDRFTYKAFDGTSYSNVATVTISITFVNHPPNKPEKPTGPPSGKINVWYTYSTKTIDVDGSQLWYWFDWDDNTTSGWVGPFDSNTQASARHQWTTKGIYFIRVKAKDVNGSESTWSDPLGITMPLIQIDIGSQNNNPNSNPLTFQEANSIIYSQRSIALNR